MLASRLCLRARLFVAPPDGVELLLILVALLLELPGEQVVVPPSDAFELRVDEQFFDLVGHRGPMGPLMRLAVRIGDLDELRAHRLLIVRRISFLHDQSMHKPVSREIPHLVRVRIHGVRVQSCGVVLPDVMGGGRAARHEPAHQAHPHVVRCSDVTNLW